MTITDVTGPGIKISSSGSAEVSACGIASILFSAGESNVICGSITIQIISGTATAEFFDGANTFATTSMVEGDDVTFDDNLLSITNNNSESLIILVSGNEVTIGPGQTFTLNNPPIADSNGPYLASIGSPTILYSTGTIDPDGDPLNYLWSTDATCTFSDPSAENT